MRKGTKTATATQNSGALLGFEAHANGNGDGGRRGRDSDPAEYRADNVFWVPPEARWSYLRERAKQPTIGEVVDNAALRDALLPKLISGEIGVKDAERLLEVRGL